MPIIRNPFRKAPGDVIHEDPLRPSSDSTDAAGFQKADLIGSKPIVVRQSIDKQPMEYQLSEIRDDGVFIPPSPPESTRSSFWLTRSNGSTHSSSHRSAVNENEPFNISRESFDSYRRSFDISARSPIMDPSVSPWARHSIDSRRARLPPPLIEDQRYNPPDSQPEDRFEDVGLQDEAIKPKRRGIFSRFADSDSHSHGQGQGLESPARPSSGHSGHHIFGRKRGQSGQGAELGVMPQTRKPVNAGPDVKNQE